MSRRSGSATARIKRLVAASGIVALLIVTVLGSGGSARAQTAAPAAPATQPAQPGAPGQPSAPAAPASVDTASYELAARWNAATNEIGGTATITYRNHSRDTLSEVWLKLYLNAFRSADTQ